MSFFTYICDQYVCILRCRRSEKLMYCPILLDLTRSGIARWCAEGERGECALPFAHLLFLSARREWVRAKKFE